MKIKCPNCGFEDAGNFCSHCGTALPQPSVAGKEVAAPDLFWTAKCPVCRTARLEMVTEKRLFGLKTTESLKCGNCGAVFTPDGDRYKLTAVKDKTNTGWQDYGNQSLTEREWKTIASGGLSDAKQHDTDMEQWFTALKEGSIPIKMLGGSSPIILKQKEELQVVLPNVALWEPRKVTRTVGGYGGPSFRIAKGVYWRVGAFGAESRSHEELKELDRGALTLTNKRLVFSGAIRTVDINLPKILSIEPYSDGVAVRSSGRQKTQYFVGIDPKRVSATVSVNDRKYEEPFTGLMLQYLIEGLIKRNEEANG